VKRLPLCATAFAILLGTGVLHALWVGRWEQANDPGTIKKNLTALPLVIGSWEGRDEDEQVAAVPAEKVGPIIIRRYVNRQDPKKVVTILLTAGRAGPMLVNHQPEDCYQAIGFNIDSDPSRYTVPAGSDGRPSDFWVARFAKKAGPVPEYVRLFWSWTSNGVWQVPKYPRLTFAGQGVLYKLYVTRSLAKPEESLEGDACIEFMQVLIPELRKTTFAGS
jgi:hypothetical protein